jgi:hypothetical protein
MEPTRSELEALDRETLIAKAETAGVGRARVLTRPELVDELIVRQNRDPDTTRRMRGLLGLARDLLARLVERGLNLPDAAERLRSVPPPPAKRTGPAVPTVTLAEIYATQGHTKKAIATLEEVLAREPDHLAAKGLLTKLQGTSAVAPDAQEHEEDDDRDERVGYEVQDDGPPPEPAHMLDADPLPPKYDVDECVAIAVDPATLYVYWEVRDATLASLRAGEKDGGLTLRVLVIVPTWDGPRTFTRDIQVDASLGDWFVRELPKDAIVRAAIGWLAPSGAFLSAAHSFTAQPAPRDRSPVIADRLARWTPEATHAVDATSSDDAEVVRVARAFARSEARRIAEELARAQREGTDALWTGSRVVTLGGSERFVTSVASS